jgi:hypothetical protein
MVPARAADRTSNSRPPDSLGLSLSGYDFDVPTNRQGGLPGFEKGLIALKRRHVILAALLIAIAAALGTYALTRTTTLGLRAKNTTTQSGSVAQWTRELNAANAALTRALAMKPPPLPGPGQTIRYVPPQPIVVTVHVPSPAQVAVIRRRDDERGRGD